jgi:hypothetical protein
MKIKRLCSRNLSRIFMYLNFCVTQTKTSLEVILGIGPLLWSSGQSFWLQIQRSWVRFPELPNFLRSSGSGMGPTQPREDNWGATWKK